MKKIITICALAYLGIDANAQMKDVTVTLQPTASYNWFDKNAAIEDGVMYGGRLGFGFGESVELRGLYEKSADLKNTVSNFDIFTDDFVNNFNARSVDIERFGGEIKANIPTRGTFVPYFTLGAGVQKLTVDINADDAPQTELKSEQTYVNLGLGTQIKLGTRLFLNLEVKNTVFNLNPNSILYQDGPNQSEFEGLLGSDNNSRMSNWSALAGLQLYLGGRAPEELSPLDRAYRNKYSGGLGGFKLIFEPAGAYINFDNDTNLRDTYLLGGKVGFDLNQYVGIRGYYYRATNNEQLSFDFDDVAMYGGDFIAKLNVSRGLVPYLTVGGGYLNVNDSYVGKDNLTGASSGYFAKGGAGLNIPVGRNVELFGDASFMFTSDRADDDLQNTVSPDELKQHVLYTAGIRFQLGKKADDTDQILQNEIDQKVKAETKVYEDRIDDLESELAKAYKNNDTQKAVEIIEEKKELERSIEVEKRRTDMKDSKSYNEDKRVNESRVEMTPKELESMIDKVIQGVDEDSRKVQTTDQRMDRLEKLLLEINTGTYRQNLSPAVQDDASQKILDKLNELNSKVDRNSDKINNLGDTQNQSQDKTVVISSGQQSPALPQTLQQAPTTVQTDSDGNTKVTSDNSKQGVVTGLVVNEGMSLFTGVVVAEDVSMIVGIRGNYNFTNSNFRFMPDLYIAPGKDTGFGINANVAMPFAVNQGIIGEPYVGLGLGYNDAVGESTFSPNVILGTTFNVLGGKLYADYTAHNFISIHQISLGYKLNF
ncbi:outer membrane beta-barrel protein [Flavobacterium algicola]|uniref:outer membrane beta-barrel protein n=1 Tax=Flavobacterium algicola TaxID=556529 RepID=UPI001EFD8879|nr:outer membrane beta-barrel protein [Flavobacterium algicola]MCG9791138.1 porin family protein [Flavobacterium algicola]